MDDMAPFPPAARRNHKPCSKMTDERESDMRTGKGCIAYRIDPGRLGPRPRPRDACSCLQRHDAAVLNNFPPLINAPLRAKALGPFSNGDGENPSARIRAMRHQALSDKCSPVKRERRAHPPGPSLLFPDSARLPPGRRKSQRIYRWFLCFFSFLP